MVEKKFCDACEKDITKDVQFELEIYDVISEKAITKSDVCEKCMKEARKHFPKNK